MGPGHEIHELVRISDRNESGCGIKCAESLTVAFEAMNADAEHPGFLQKIKDKLHIGSHHKSDEDSGVPSQATTESAAVSGKSVTDAAVPTPPEKEAEPGVATPAPVTSHFDVKPEGRQHGHPTPDLNTLVGHEAEHHGGVPTFLVALPEQDIPDEVTKDTAAYDVVKGQTGAPGGGDFDSEEVFSKAQQGEHHEGVPTFLVALPDQDIPDTVNKETSSDVSAVPTEEHQHSTQDKELHSDEMFSNAHHGGVPTFMVALPNEEIPEEVNKGVSESDTTSVGEKSVSGDTGVKQFNSEAVFSQARQGEHHEGVPTFLVALPDQDIPDEVTKGVDATAAPAPAPSVDDAALEGSLLKR